MVPLPGGKTRFLSWSIEFPLQYFPFPFPSAKALTRFRLLFEFPRIWRNLYCIMATKNNSYSNKNKNIVNLFLNVARKHFCYIIAYLKT